jgi:DMSO/TMAO reductase YedYZ molybdopterin-dependent catalytic subunit/thiosulfate reductase cytochrome b subunit
MVMPAFHLGFPLWLRLCHFLNFLWITLLIRSGIQILADHPMLYFNDDCTPGTEWIKFSKIKPATDRIWTSADEEMAVSSWIALPGGKHTLGLARHWHFLCAAFWVVNGLIYIVLLFATANWPRLIPLSWEILPDAGQAIWAYLHFQIPAVHSPYVYNALQQLTYAIVIFVMSPLMILTGLALSPAISAQFPGYLRVWGGRQKARSLHFALMVCYVLFIVIHVSLVIIEDFTNNMDKIVLGLQHQQEGLAVVIGLIGIGLVGLLNVLATIWSQQKPRQVQYFTCAITERLSDWLFKRMKSQQAYTASDVSPYFWVNGLPPETEDWQAHAQEGFAHWKLHVYGEVDEPLVLSLADLQTMPAETHITKHCCIQGWSGVAEWTGVPVREILKCARPLPSAQYLIFHSYQTDKEGHEYYDSLDMQDALAPQTILAYRMNGKTLPIQNGAPLRLRMETKLGFKMVKWIRAVELVTDYQTIGLGQGGYREDYQFFTYGAEI